MTTAKPILQGQQRVFEQNLEAFVRLTHFGQSRMNVLARAKVKEKKYNTPDYDEDSS